MSTAPIVFLGPSLPRADAAHLLEADFRPPIRRGDLDELGPGHLVGIIDGVFEQHLAISPREIHQAIARNVTIVGGSSMGALRATEVPAMIGVGKIYEWYRDGIIHRDDEVALAFDPEDDRPLTVPLVNVRFALERLLRPGTIDERIARRILDAARALPYERRTYQTILRAAGLHEQLDAEPLAAMLGSHDLKRQDAQAVLEELEIQARSARPHAALAHAPPTNRSEPTPGTRVFIWESGDACTLDELLEHLACTGKLERHARSALVRYALEGNAVDAEIDLADLERAAQQRLTQAARRWGWSSAEEVQITLSDLGIDLPVLTAHLREDVAAGRVVEALLREGSEPLRQALRTDLLLGPLDLKREVMRLGSLRYLAARDDGDEPRPDELAAARAVLCRACDELDWSALTHRWSRTGLAPARRDAYVDTLIRARRTAGRITDAMRGKRTAAPAPSLPHLVPASPKPPGERRFSLPIDAAHAQSMRLRSIIGITRVGAIGQLGDIGAVHVAQAARPDGAWSSTYGSGKARSRRGAEIGSVMEELEKWSQERYRVEDQPLLHGNYRALRERVRALDPGSLDLPHDSAYYPDLPLSWLACPDLLDSEPTYVPVDVLVMERRKCDIAYTRRGARKHLATNGLGSGFSLAEGLLHAVCEIVERHAQRIAELYLSNPGGLGAQPYSFVDLARAPAPLPQLVASLERTGATVRVLDITSEVRIPTFAAAITRESRRADGYACHPDPATAVEMALCEAAQTISCAAAGGREDLSIHARSLGRHERPRPVSAADAWFWMDPDTVTIDIADVAGFTSTDVRDDLAWCLQRLRAAGLRRVPYVDLSRPAIEPARVVRVLIPDLETNNPFYTGPRARAVLLRDLVPRWQ